MRTGQRIRGCAAWVLVAMVIHGPSLAQEIRNKSKELSDTLVYKLTKAKTPWILTRADDGTSTGTGVLIDAQNRYVLTAAHVVKGATTIVCFFPSQDAGDEINNPRFYVNRAESLGIRAEIVAIDESKDLALIQLRPAARQAGLVPDLPIPFATMDVEVGQSLLTVGSSGANDGNLWRFSGGSSRNIYRRQINYPSQHVDAIIIENQVTTNPGDSGGPVMSSYGVLVGINSGSDGRSELIRFAISRAEIQRFLEKTPFPICVCHLMSLQRVGDTLTYTYQIYDNSLRPRYRHVLVIDQGIRVLSSTVTAIR